MGGGEKEAECLAVESIECPLGEECNMKKRIGLSVLLGVGLLLLFPIVMHADVGPNIPWTSGVGQYEGAPWIGGVGQCEGAPWASGVGQYEGAPWASGVGQYEGAPWIGGVGQYKGADW